MNANEAKLRPIIEGTKQYVVPLFQRAYSWGNREWGVLWTDLVGLLEDVKEDGAARDHFMGSIVTMQTTSVPEGVSKYMLIDGQQRMTTMFVLLILMRDIARQHGSTNMADEIQNTLITNPYKQDLDHYRLLPTQVDRNAFFALVNGHTYQSASGITNCYQYFVRQLRQAENPEVMITRLYKIVSDSLSFVSIVLSHQDNPYLVFESLNAKGKPLSQADLIRNYFFMRVDVSQQDMIYRDYWLPMFEALGDSMTEFMRHYLMRDGSFVKASDVYEALKSRVNNNNAVPALEDLRFYAGLYDSIIHPEKEPVLAVRERINRIVRLEATVFYPFMLSCYAEFRTREMSQDTFEKILEMIENMLIRRFISNYQNKALNRELPKLHREIRGRFAGSYLIGLPILLQQRGYPSDGEVRSWVLSKPIYGGGSRLELTKAILSRIEAFLAKKEVVNLEKMTIEHVMPQTLTSWWKEHLGADWEALHMEKQHTLGNLTLTGVNPVLSNKSYPEKRDIFVHSNISMNKYFTQSETWDAAAIAIRAEYIAGLVLQVWPDIRPEKTPGVHVNPDEITFTKPLKMTVRGEEIAVQHWSEVLEHTIEYVYTFADDESFAEIMQRYPGMIIRNPGVSEGASFAETFRLNLGFSAKATYQYCYDMFAIAGLGSDEVTIQYISTKA
jgi:uncharacterized protein with ParB-like and HNH nuclease domain